MNSFVLVFKGTDDTKYALYADYGKDGVSAKVSQILILTLILNQSPLKPKIYRNTMNFFAVQNLDHQLNFIGQRFPFLFESYAPLIGKTIKGNQQNHK